MLDHEHANPLAGHELHHHFSRYLCHRVAEKFPY